MVLSNFKKEPTSMFDDPRSDTDEMKSRGFERMSHQDWGNAFRFITERRLKVIRG